MTEKRIGQGGEGEDGDDRDETGHGLSRWWWRRLGL
jgi:hypothetical protein